jgi:hypothetical protein
MGYVPPLAIGYIVKVNTAIRYAILQQEKGFLLRKHLTCSPNP